MYVLIVFILMLGVVHLLNIRLLWGLDEGDYLLVDGGMLTLTVTIKLLAPLTYQLGRQRKLTEHYPCHGIRPTGLSPLIAQ